ncbi:MAG: hypothetical protein KGQ95_04170 [Acidobacteria bacterium]|nr:hypothetical protein [Acidobacteriota bacterium]
MEASRATPSASPPRGDRMPVMGVLLRALLIVLAIAALIGLGIVFAGPEDTVMRVLGTVMVLGGALVVAMPAALIPQVALRVAMAAVVAIEAVLMWVIIWAPDSNSLPDWVGRASAMIVTFLVVAAVAIVLWKVTRGERLRTPRIVAAVSTLAGVVFGGMIWAMILTDGEAMPARVLAGVAIIYAATALGALVLALMRSYAVVRRS